MAGAVDEVRVRDERGGEADDGAVERGDEDLGVRVEGVRDFEVVAGYVAEGFAVDVGGVGGVGGGAADGDVGAGGEVAAYAGEDGDGDVREGGDGAEELGEVVVEVLG